MPERTLMLRMGPYKTDPDEEQLERDRPEKRLTAQLR